MGTIHSARKKIDFFATRFRLMKEKDLIISEKKIIAQFCIEHASTQRKAKEIIKMFEDAGEIKRIGSELMSEKTFNDEMGKTLSKTGKREIQAETTA
jgi:hypothetical protein